MYRLLTGVLFLLPLTATAADPPAAPKGGLKEHDNIPGSFLPFNVTGPNKGRFHCVVSDYGLEPVVLLFVRDVQATDAVKNLLKELDNRIEKNRGARLHAAAIFLSPDLPDVFADDDQREALAKRLEDAANALGLKHVVIALDSPADVAKYVPGDAPATAVLYDKYRVVAVHPLPKADAQARVDAILADVGAKLKAAKTK